MGTEDSILFKDFVSFLSFLKGSPAPLTQTGNLGLKALALISEFIPQPPIFKEIGFSLRSESNWRYLEEIDVLAKIMSLTMRRKKRLILTRRGKDYLALPEAERYRRLFAAYWREINWAWLFPFGTDKGEPPAQRLQLNRDKALKEMLDFKKNEAGWSDFESFAEHLRKTLDLKLINHLGEDLPERVQDCVRDLILRHFRWFGLVEYDRPEDDIRYDHKEVSSFRLTPRGLSFLKTLEDAPDLASQRDADRRFQETMGRRLNSILSDKEPEADIFLDEAQDLIYDAWEEPDPRRRVALARRALELSPDCADACNLLAEDAAGSGEEALAWYQRGVEAGRHALGEETFKECAGHFWGAVETRPYMRARAGLARCLWQMGRHQEAVGHYREMLSLNRSDNQGIRYVLAACYAELGSYDELENLLNMNEYNEDTTCHWSYTRALLAFQRNGDCQQSRRELAAAWESNKYTPAYLLRIKSLPRLLPDRITLGGEDEALSYAADFLPGWEKVPGALDWLRRQIDEKPGWRKVGRNEPCPCGSGKKFKKCCGGRTVAPAE